MQRYVFIIANFFIAKGKIAISKFLKLKNYINLLVRIVHVVYQYNSMKYKQINSKNIKNSTQFLIINFEH